MADTGKDAVKAAKDAEKAAIKAKKERIKKSKPKKEGSPFSRAGKRIKKYWKDFIGTIKKIVWPPRKQVLKSSAVVLVSIIVVGLVIYGFDWGLVTLFDYGKDSAVKLGEVYAVTTVEDEANAAADAANANAAARADAVVTTTTAPAAQPTDAPTEAPTDAPETPADNAEESVTAADNAG